MFESNLTRQLKKSGFICGIEQVVYYRTLGKYTTLYFEGEKATDSNRFMYSFYKMRLLPNGKTIFKVYCDRVPLKVAIKRIESFALYIELHQDSTGRWFT